MSEPVGFIFMWGGALVDIPENWQLCDGTNGTPDLRNRFVIGSGDTYAQDQIGGGADHTHTFTGDGHTHTLPAFINVKLGFDFYEAGSTEPTTGTTDADQSLPPYYALAYIAWMVP